MSYDRFCTEDGIVFLTGETRLDVLEALGFSHAVDRGLQLQLTRMAARGTLCEHFGNDETLLPIDFFNRRMDWFNGANNQLARLSARSFRLCETYVNGINRGLQLNSHRSAFPANASEDWWQVTDSIALARMVGYFSLAQSQAQIERLLIELIQAGVNRTLLDDLFPGIIGEIDEGIIRSLTLHDRNVPVKGFWGQPLPRMMASNNWAVAGFRTESGLPFLASDPHLEINRLPSVWYEVMMKGGKALMMGATMPGIPGVWIGRNQSVAWGATYAFMDQVDSWIEHCSKDRFRREDGWKSLNKRIETVARKGKPPINLPILSTIHGVLDGDPPRDGYSLATMYSGATGGAGMVSSFLDMWDVTSVAEGMRCLGPVEMGCSWTLADNQGNIGFQMSGSLPKRCSGCSGFSPLLGWKHDNDWTGFADFNDFPKSFNPKDGYVITANNDLNIFGKLKPINMPMSSYRAQRIHDLLDKPGVVSIQKMMEIQHDVNSLQAEVFLKEIRPFLPESASGKKLKDWDCRYSVDSEGAFLFEQVYRALIRTYFSVGVGAKAVDFLEHETSTFIDFHQNFDRIMLAQNTPWLQGRKREDLYRHAIFTGLSHPPRPWGEAQTVTLQDQVDRLTSVKDMTKRAPRISLKGGRSTIHQGQVYQSGGIITTFAPSFQMVADMATDGVYSSICGGVSESPNSPEYDSEVGNWVDGSYKFVQPGTNGAVTMAQSGRMKRLGPFLKP